MFGAQGDGFTITYSHLTQRNNLPREEVSAFCTLLRSKHVILRKVSLRGVKLGSDGAQELFNALAANQSVEEIDLSGTKMADDGSSQKALLAMAESLSQNSKLEIVRVSVDAD